MENKVNGPSTLLRTNAEVFRVRVGHANVEEQVRQFKLIYSSAQGPEELAAREHGPQGMHPRVSADESTSIKGVRN